MHDILEQLEAKRELARQGGGAKRIAALINLNGFALSTPAGLYLAMQFDFGAVAPQWWALLVLYALAASVWVVWLWMTGLRGGHWHFGFSRRIYAGTGRGLCAGADQLIARHLARTEPRFAAVAVGLIRPLRQPLGGYQQVFDEHGHVTPTSLALARRPSHYRLSAKRRHKGRWGR